MITHKRLLELFSYDPETGCFKRKISRRGTSLLRRVGRIDRCGYRMIDIDNRVYPAARLAFFYMNKRWPAHEIDHINRDPADDRLANLREATRSQNSCNTRLRRTNTSGARGVRKHKNHWEARICIGPKQHRHLGSFPTLEEASRAYQDAAKAQYGEFFAADQLTRL